MATKHKLVPNHEHPIALERNAERVTVVAGDRVVADTTRAITLRESDYDPVYYIPIDDVRSDLLAASDHATYCPYKGDCNHFTIAFDEFRSENAVWVYHEPFEAVREIAGHLAFYPSRVDRIDVRAAS
jgi:uncharacterized protein (DUF427 family)